MSNPLISILIPAYNVDKYIYQCLESVCRQSYRNLQIVVIDDGSKDSTLSIISRFAEKDNRIEVITRENRGVARTRNELLDRAKGEFVLFVDSDDWIEPEMISTLVRLKEEYSVDLVMCRKIYNNTDCLDENCTINVWDKEEILDRFMRHRELTGSLWNKLIKRSLFYGIRFQPDISYGEDAMVIWDILNKVDKMVYTTKAYYHHRMNEYSISYQGLSEPKMSVITVWEYICSKAGASDRTLGDKALARFGGEISLLMFEYFRGESTYEGEKRVIILRKKLKELYRFMLKDENISYKLKVFAGLCILNQPFLKFLSKRLKAF